MRTLIVLASLALCACTGGTFTPSEAASAAERASLAKRGAARTVLFKECMELAAKMPRQADDDVADVVSQCSTQAYYMTAYLE